MMNRMLMLMSIGMLLCHTSCQTHKKEKAAETKYLVTSPLKIDTFITDEYVCQIQSIRHIELRAQERGYLQNIYVDEGQFVKKGQLLFRIMPNLYEAEMHKAKAEANFAEIEYNNTKGLADSNIVSKNELAMAAAKLNKAKAELSLAEVHLQFTEIRAPFDGIIDRFFLKLGSLVDEGDLLTNLSDNSTMWVYFNVPEAEYLEYQAHVNTDSAKNVKLLMANNRVFEQAGRVEVIEADFNNETGNIAFRATFPNPKRLLRHGETGNIQMQVPLKDAVVIPQKATFEMLDKHYVFVIDQHHVAKLREVVIEAEMPDLFVIRKGLNDKDIILLEGLRKVSNNDKISYEYEEPKSVISNLKLYTE